MHFFLEEKNIFLHKPFELGTSNLAGCSQKCATFPCPWAVVEGCSMQVMSGRRFCG